MTLLIYIAIYERQEIAPIVYEHLQIFQKEAKKRGVDSYPLVIYSKDDDLDLFDAYFDDYIPVKAKNRPLGQKFNAGLEYLQGLDFDYLFQIGCDDIVKPEYLDVIIPEMEAKTPFFGCKNLIVHQISTGKTRNSGYSDVFGAARCIRRDLVLKAARCYPCKVLASTTAGYRKGNINHVPEKYAQTPHFEIIGDLEFKIWTDTKESGLDFDSECHIIKTTGIIPKTVDGDEYYVIDIKTGDNIHTFDEFKGEVFKAQLAELI